MIECDIAARQCIKGPTELRKYVCVKALLSYVVGDFIIKKDDIDLMVSYDDDG